MKTITVVFLYFFAQLALAQKPTSFLHVEAGSGARFCENCDAPYIPMLRVGWMKQIDSEAELYVAAHVGTYWSNPGIGALLDANLQIYTVTILQATSLFLIPEAGYALEFDPKNGGSPFLGGGVSFDSSLLVNTFRGWYLTRTKAWMLQVGIGIRI